MAKRWMAALMCVGMLFGMLIPGVSAEVSEDEFVFPEFSDTYVLCEPLMGNMTITEYAELYSYQGRDYLLVPAKGGKLYVFNLSDFLEGSTDENWIYDQEDTGINIPRCIVEDSTGKFYICGGANHLYVYDFKTGSGYNLNLPTNRGSVSNLAIDEEDNLYVTLASDEPTLPGRVLKVDTRNGNEVSVLFESMEIDGSGTGAIAYGDGHIYFIGNIRNATQGIYLYKVDAVTGEAKGRITYSNTKFLLYMSYIDGVVFGGNSGSVGDGMIAIDSQTMQDIDVGVEHWIMGAVPPPRNGITYMVCSDGRSYQYDTQTRKMTYCDNVPDISINLRIRDPYLTANYKTVSGDCMLTMSTSGATPYLISLNGQGAVSLKSLTKAAMSSVQTRSIAPGIPGVKVYRDYGDGTFSAKAEEVSVYVGGFLTPRVASYSPNQEDEYDRLNPAAFSTGHAQTDSMIVYKDKLYAGCYSGCFLVEYDPVTGTTRDLIPEGLFKDYSQVRLHGLAAGDDKIFFSTIPTTNYYGGVVGWVDLISGKLTVIENPVPKQTVISLAYDEETKILYGASSTKNGNNTPESGEKEAKIFVYDVGNDKRLGVYAVRSSENPYSDMKWEQTDVLPYYIAGVSQDPDTGKIWGIVGRTLFSLFYDPAVRGLRIHEEWAPEAGGKTIYASSSAMHWFSRPMLFDGEGHMYVSMESFGIIRFDTNDPSNHIKVGHDGSRIACIGTDGNLYIGGGEELQMIALNRVSIVRTMIDGTDPEDWEKVKQARLAYNALTDEEKAQLPQCYHEGIEALEAAAEAVLGRKAGEVDSLIEKIGVITITSLSDLKKVRSAYDNLPQESKDQVRNYGQLLDAEQAYEKIKIKTVFSEEKSVYYGFGGVDNPGTKSCASLKDVKYGHTAGTLWEYYAGSAKFNGRDHLQMSFGSDGNNYLALKIKVMEAGMYDLDVKTMAYSGGCLSNIYLFPVAGTTDQQLLDQINAEVTACSPDAPHRVGVLQAGIDENQRVGCWDCKSPGEYVLVFGLLKRQEGANLRFRSLTISKQDPVTDSVVELAKSRINAIGKVSINSKLVIQEARWSYDALSEEQKQLIYAPQLEQAEKVFAELKAAADADAKAAALVQVQIGTIGSVTAASGETIRSARKAYDDLTDAQKALVNNYDKLILAEEEYAKLTEQSGDVQPGEDNTLTYTVIAVCAVLLALTVVLAVAIAKRKKALAAEKTKEE